MIRTRLLAAAAALLVLAACGKKEPEPKVDRAARKALSAQAKSTLGVLPETMPGSEADSPQLVALGKELYLSLIHI